MVPLSPFLTWSHLEKLRLLILFATQEVTGKMIREQCSWTTNEQTNRQQQLMRHYTRLLGVTIYKYPYNLWLLTSETCSEWSQRSNKKHDHNIQKNHDLDVSKQLNNVSNVSTVTFAHKNQESVSPTLAFSNKRLLSRVFMEPARNLEQQSLSWILSAMTRPMRWNHNTSSSLRSQQFYHYPSYWTRCCV